MIKMFIILKLDKNINIKKIKLKKLSIHFDVIVKLKKKNQN